ncbi:hypothetical protein DRB96_07110 [Streptomyces sp. ICC1]|nr:hypothetical protein DRB89_07315 [Streptomyces sp. ICC4]AWZ12126.1 hypothetical protein DRB96_07110 [Streptomyces sp. ICC1]
MTIDWDGLCATGFGVPVDVDLDELTEQLASCLRDPDPQVRDGAPYVVLRTWIARDVIAGPQRLRLGDDMARRFTDSEIQARTFAPLVLDMIVTRGDFRQTWLEAFGAWFPEETDLRGHDPKLGWLHAVAHGADLLGTFGTHPDVDPAAMLALATERILARTDHVWDQQEDDRLAGAIARVLTRPELSAAAATAWLDPIAADFGAIGRGPKPAYASNAMRTLRMLYLLLDRGAPLVPNGPKQPVPHAEPLKVRLASVLDHVFGHPPVKDFPPAA